jgi:Short C-terminal domain
MDFTASNFWDVLLWSLFFFIFIAALFVWFRVLLDLFSDKSLSGWAKAIWAVFLIFIPWLSAFVYLIARGKGMAERQVQQVTEAKQAQDEYIKSVAGTSVSPAEQISQAQSLLQSGAISQEEFDSLKAKALS